MPKALAIQINWQFTDGAGIMQVEHTADYFVGAWFKSPLSTEVWHPRHIRRETAFQFQVSKQQTHQSGEPIWHAFTQFVKKTSVPDSVICCCQVQKDGAIFRFCWNPFSINVVRAATWSQVLRPFRKPAWSGLNKPSTVGEMRWRARRSRSL